ncbi:MAG: hypothetical protein KC912_01915 [Proteobacteria bacterium]|nr:hypothetical protein [Pseudomonadota bacterium]
MPIREAIARLIAPAPEAPAPDPRIAELDARIAKLEKRLSMTMGALQASAAQLTSVKAAAEQALSTARQASQLATTARSTADSVAEGLDALESETAPDLSVLDGSVKAVKAALATGAYDAHLDALASAEAGAKNRKGVLTAIGERRG